jgi:hypothetical protein
MAATEERLHHRRHIRDVLQRPDRSPALVVQWRVHRRPEPTLEPPLARPDVVALEPHAVSRVMTENHLEGGRQIRHAVGSRIGGIVGGQASQHQR